MGKNLLLSIICLLVLGTSGGIFYMLESQHPAPNSFWFIAIAALQSLNIVAAWWTLNLFFKKIIWQSYETKKGHPPHRFLVDLVKISNLIGAILIILVVVFNQPLSHIPALITVVSAGLVYALHALILDIFAGFVLDFQRPFKEGDWIEFGEKGEAKVLESDWRCTKLMTPDGQVLYVPNGNLTKVTIMNYCQPALNYVREIEVIVDHEVPVERAHRILTEGTNNINCSEVLRCNVYAFAANEKGIVYTIKFEIREHAVWRTAQHMVLLSITNVLHSYGLHLSQDIGVYALKRADKHKTMLYLPPAHSTISKLDLFQSVKEDDINYLSENLIDRTFKAGEVIVSQGEEGSSMFIIAEGLVEVSVAQSFPNALDNKGHNAGPLKAVRLLGHHEYFGERVLLLGEHRSATVHAKSSVHLYELKKDIFKSVLDHNPELIAVLSALIQARDEERFGVEQANRMVDKETRLQEIMSDIKQFFFK